MFMKLCLARLKEG